MAVVGSATIQATLFDQTNGGGTILSSGSLSTSIVSGVANAATVTFNPVIASVTASLASLTTGTAGSAKVTVVAKDPDGNTIIGPGSFVNASGSAIAISITDSDQTGHTTLSTTSYSSASSTSPMVNYDGTPLKGNYPTITVSAPFGSPIAMNLTVTPAIAWTRATQINAPRVLKLGSDGNIWFGADSTSGPVGEVGNVTPAGLVTDYPVGSVFVRSMALGSDGNMWYGLTADSSTTRASIVRVTPTGGITTFAIPNEPGSARVPINQPQVVAGADNTIWYFVQYTTAAQDTYYYSINTAGTIIKSGPLTTPNAGSLEASASSSTGFWLVFESSPYEHVFVTLSGTGVTIPYPSTLQGQVIGELPELEDIIVSSSDDTLWEGAQVYTIEGSSLYDTGVALVNTNKDGSSVAYPLSGYTTTGGIAEGVDHRLWFVQSNGYSGELEAMTKTGVVTDTGLAISASAERMVATPDGSLYFGIYGGGIEKIIY